MREGIHPNYYQAKVVCNCGNEFVTGSTKESIHVEICSKCHSFYTGRRRQLQLVDVLISSTKNTALTHKTIRKDKRVEVFTNLNLFFSIGM